MINGTGENVSCSTRGEAKISRWPDFSGDRLYRARLGVTVDSASASYVASVTRRRRTPSVRCWNRSSIGGGWSTPRTDQTYRIARSLSAGSTCSKRNCRLGVISPRSNPRSRYMLSDHSRASVRGSQWRLPTLAICSAALSNLTSSPGQTGSRPPPSRAAPDSESTLAKAKRRFAPDGRWKSSDAVLSCDGRPSLSVIAPGLTSRSR